MKHKTFVWGFSALILTAAILLCSCQDHPTLKPVDTTTDESENSFGARCTFTLKEFTETSADAFEDLEISLKDDGWQTINVGLIDDNGVKYSSYYQHTGEITFTAAVEYDSQKVMNIGCGCETKKLEDPAFRKKLLKSAAVTAQTIGGYAANSTMFFEFVFSWLSDCDDDALYYGNSLLIKSVDQKTTVLMTAPCSEEVREKNRYRKISD